MAINKFKKRLIKKLSYYREVFTLPFWRPMALKRWFRKCNGRELHLNPPVTFCDKINWIKLHGVTDEMTRLSDKYLVRDWIKEKIGEEYLIPLIGVYDSFEEIDFSSFPERFVLKTNHACNNTIVVKDRSHFDKKDAAEKFKEWLSYDFAFRFGYQMQYHPIQRKIIAEEFIENGGDDLFDYKFYCFDGKPLFCKLIGGRAKDPRLGMFDMDWNPLPYHETVHPLFDEMPDKPARYDRLVEIAGILCQGFPFVRVDLYHLDDGSIKFGEMTFTPGSGQSTWLPEGTDEMLGAMIPVP